MIKTLTRAEEQVMQALWKIDKGFTKEIIQQFEEPRPHYNTISTLLRILADKGFVTAESIGNTHLYRPVIAKDQYGKQSMKQLIKGYFDGSFGNMLHYFTHEKEIDIKELEKVLQKLKKGKS